MTSEFESNCGFWFKLLSKKSRSKNEDAIVLDGWIANLTLNRKPDGFYLKSGLSGNTSVRVEPIGDIETWLLSFIRFVAGEYELILKRMIRHSDSVDGCVKVAYISANDKTGKTDSLLYDNGLWLISDDNFDSTKVGMGFHEALLTMTIISTNTLVEMANYSIEELEEELLN